MGRQDVGERTRGRSGRWLDDEVADLFRAAGCAAEARVDVEGARGTDNVDVVVEFRPLGISDVWAVECRDKASRVKRGDVQLFQKKVENIGASRGIFVSTSGYQSGCGKVAAKTNILLLTLPELRAVLDGEVTRQRVQHLLARVTVLVDRLHSLKVNGTKVPGKPFRLGMTMRLPSGPRADQYLTRLGMLSFVKEEVTDVLVGRATLRVPRFDEDPIAEKRLFEVLSTPREFCDHVEGFLADTETWAKGLVPPD